MDLPTPTPPLDWAYSDPAEQRRYVRALQKTVLDVNQPAKIRKATLKQYVEARSLISSMELLREIYNRKDPKCPMKRKLSSRKK